MDSGRRIIERVLQQDALVLHVVHYVMSEYVGPAAQCRVTLTLRSVPGPVQRQTIDCVGAGFIEAVYRGLVMHFAQHYQVISGLKIVQFEVGGRMETRRDAKGLDAEAHVRLHVQTARKDRFAFERSSRSTLAASILTVAAVMEHFINAERAATRLRLQAELARTAGQIDALTRIRNDLEELRPLVA